ncbi:chromosome condensation complex Condensin, subunit G [Recurvomyces mirabilis]|uniref:Chromosome condensation complex Condensin, subunit G n=1 Tax=Recurvomyces mirabilis TaxID=574656 RepID=A0AAE0WXK5_9PEZI|nr:chromosome condensation complex Condensin, subunit G [Recurvomyces mirabilis]KAK5161789.1 chromosome condensation complex Condensin, subunit G [Recurvomyces mirabilis]
MPGRVARGGRTAVSRKTSARTSSPSADVPDEGRLTSLRRAICIVFADAQKSTAGHRKAVISLRKIQEACCYEPVNYKKGKQSEDFDEADFNVEVTRCVLRILAVRKAEPVGDRVVRFLGTYLNVASAKDAEIAAAGQETEMEIDGATVPETPTSRLTTSILSTLLPLLNTKDKTIRFRSTQIISHIINSLDSLDDNLFHKLRLALLKRIHDKEAPVRLQAVYGLGRLAAEVDDDTKQDDSDEEEDDVGAGVLAKLLNILQNDPAAEVRRNLLLNLPLTKEVLPYLLERARDADASTRRALYARLLPALGDFRHLSLTHREKLLRWGLRDRDENVRKATARLFRERWIEDCAALPAEQAAEQEGEAPKAVNQAADPSLDALLELLERIDIVTSGGDGGIALLAMKEFWSGRPDYIDYVSFPDNFWEDLSPELAFVARTFNDYCRSAGKEDGYEGPRMLDGMIEDKLPEVTKFGFLLEREIAKLIQSVQLAAIGEDEEAEEECVQREFVVEQMLYMAATFDYSDEVGRRKMFGLLREALANPELPEEATRLVVDVLRLVCGVDRKGEQEFCRVVVEAAGEVHDVIMDEDDTAEVSSVEESFHSATEVIEEDEDGTPVQKSKKKNGKELTEEELEQKAIREIVVNMKCLHIALCMLQNVGCELESNAHLVTLLNTLIVPAVRSREAPIRERGLCCLGLCCLLSLNLAEENLELFLHCFNKGHPALQTAALQIIGDVLVTHPTLLTTPAPAAEGETTIGATSVETAQGQKENALLKPVLKAFTRSLKATDPTVQSTGAVALSKTMLARLITSPDLLKHLILCFFDPDTASNAQLRQSLSYFLPVYAHSRAENAERVASVAVSVIAKLATLREALMDEAEADSGNEGEGAGAMVKLSVVGGMLVDWTDPRHVVGFSPSTKGSPAAQGAGDLHFALAEHILERLVTSQVSKEEKRVLFSMLGKLHLPAASCGPERLKSVLELVQESIDSRVATEVTLNKLLTKMRDLLIAMMNAVMAAERGGGGAEETVVESTEFVENDPTTAEQTTGAGAVADEFSELSVDEKTVVPGVETTALATGEVEEGDELDDETTMLQRTDAVGRDTTIGAPDAEGTRVVLGVGDTELLYSDEEEIEDELSL